MALGIDPFFPFFTAFSDFFSFFLRKPQLFFENMLRFGPFRESNL